MATFTIDRDINLQLGGFEFRINAGTVSCPDDLVDELSNLVGAASISNLSYDRNASGGGIGVEVTNTPSGSGEVLTSSSTSQAAWAAPAESGGGGGVGILTDGTISVSDVTTINVPKGAVADGGGGEADLNVLVNRNGGLARCEVVADAGTAKTLDWSAYLSWDLTLSATCALSFSNVPNVSGREATIYVTLHGNEEVTWPESCTLHNADIETGTRQATVTTSDGGTSFGVTFTPAAAPTIDALGLITTETDTALALAPDGAGGVQWRAEAAAATPVGTRIGYGSITANVNITGTADSTANIVVATGTNTYDGTAISIRAWLHDIKPDSGAAGRSVTLLLYEDSTLLGYAGFVRTPAASNMNATYALDIPRTPSAGSHSYTLKAKVSAGTGTISAGAGGADELPGWIGTFKA